jgi:hypothetical protein
MAASIPFTAFAGLPFSSARLTEFMSNVAAPCTPMNRRTAVESATAHARTIVASITEKRIDRPDNYGHRAQVPLPAMTFMKLSTLMK